MSPRPLATSTIAFGLVAVPVRIFPATRSSGGLSFHLLHDAVRERIRALIARKVEGGETAIAEDERPKARVIDLMEARKASLAAKSAPRAATRRPVAKTATPRRKAS